MPQDKPAAVARPSEYSANSAYFSLLNEYDGSANLSEFYMAITAV
ncbi:hypothetical protein [Serratia nevei]|nr:hypothetical protein [Serratia nevei]